MQSKISLYVQGYNQCSKHSIIVTGMCNSMRRTGIQDIPGMRDWPISSILWLFFYSMDSVWYLKLLDIITVYCRPLLFKSTGFKCDKIFSRYKLNQKCEQSARCIPFSLRFYCFSFIWRFLCHREAILFWTLAVDQCSFEMSHLDSLTAYISTCMCISYTLRSNHLPEIRLYTNLYLRDTIYIYKL